MEKMFKMLAALLGLLSAPVSERDEEKMAKTIKDLRDAMKAAEESGDLGKIAEIEQKLTALQKQHDEQVEQVKRLSKLGLTLAPDNQRIQVLNYDEVMSLRRTHQVFRYRDQAEGFGAIVARAIYGGTPKYNDIVAPRTRDLAESLIKEIGQAQMDKDLDPGVSGSGAELVAALYMADLIAHLEAVGVLYTQCNRVPLQTTGATTWPKLTGELTAYPTAVAAKIAESAPTLSTISLTPIKWATLTPIPNEFFRNPTLLANLGQLMAFLITRAMAYAWDNAMVNGDGTADYGTITGLLQDTNLTSVTPNTATHDLLSEYDGTDVGSVIAGITKDYVTDPRWYMSLSAERTLRNIRTGGEGLPLFERGNNGEPNTIDGYPYSICQRFPASASVTASTKWGAFGDLRLSHYFGMLQGVTIDQSEHSRFESDVTVIRGLAHVDAALADENAIVIAKSGPAG